MKLIDNKLFLIVLLVLNACLVIWGITRDGSELAKYFTTISVIIAGACFCRLAYMFGTKLADRIEFSQYLKEREAQERKENNSDEIFPQNPN